MSGKFFGALGQVCMKPIGLIAYFNRRKFQSNLMGLFGFLTFLLLLCLYFFGGFSIFLVQKQQAELDHERIFLGLIEPSGTMPVNMLVVYLIVGSLVCISVYLLLLNQFRRRIYLPIVNLEKVFHGIVEGETEFDIQNVHEESFLYPLYTDVNLMVDRLRDLIFREYNAKIMRKQAELNALQSQINPHFLYNTLESIRGQAITHGLDDIEIMTKALSDLFRYSISKKGNLVLLEEELKNVENYMMIQQYRFDNKFNFINQVDEDALNCRIPKLLIQPIVENAIHHGLETKSGPGSIWIKAYITRKRLIVNVQDDGLGISHVRLVEINQALVNGQAEIDQEQTSLRIGLINVNERIRLNFGPDYGLRVYSTKGIGTTVEITLPLITEEHVQLLGQQGLNQYS